MAGPVSITGIEGIPEVQTGDDVAGHIAEAAARQGLQLLDDDVVVVTQKSVSKAEGRFVILDEIEPSEFATQLANNWEKDARHVEVVLRESKRIVRMDHGAMHQMYPANASCYCP